MKRLLRRVRFNLVETADTITHHLPPWLGGRHHWRVCDYYDRLLLGWPEPLTKKEERALAEDYERSVEHAPWYGNQPANDQAITVPTGCMCGARWSGYGPEKFEQHRADVRGGR